MTTMKNKFHKINSYILLNNSNHLKRSRVIKPCRWKSLNAIRSTSSLKPYSTNMMSIRAAFSTARKSEALLWTPSEEIKPTEEKSSTSSTNSSTATEMVKYPERRSSPSSGNSCNSKVKAHELLIYCYQHYFFSSFYTLYLYQNHLLMTDENHFLCFHSNASCAWGNN